MKIKKDIKTDIKKISLSKDEKTENKIISIPKDFKLAFNHNTHVVIVPKQETSLEDRTLKKIIKEDYKYIFRDVLVYRKDEILKKNFGNNFRGRTVTAVEYRTGVSEKELKIINAFILPTMTFEGDRMKKRISERIVDEKNKNN